MFVIVDSHLFEASGNSILDTSEESVAFVFNIIVVLEAVCKFRGELGKLEEFLLTSGAFHIVIFNSLFVESFVLNGKLS